VPITIDLVTENLEEMVLVGTTLAVLEAGSGTIVSIVRIVIVVIRIER